MEYTYKAYVTDVYDGDSITVDVDLGFKTVIKDMKQGTRIDFQSCRGRKDTQSVGDYKN
jgi:uncharacterized Zn ribbon protein